VLSFKKLSIGPFLLDQAVLVDVRSPAEFLHARIPGAVNLPLFTDEERSIVGTCYKQQGQREAIALGVQLVGPKLYSFLEDLKRFPHSPFRVYCWRGGMRSSFMAWFFQFTGAVASSLDGGYKVFRRHVSQILTKPYQFQVLGGFTGSGKTEYLAKLAANGHQIIDLEAIAIHRGSAFGAVGSQPSNEQFENELAMKLSCLDPEKPIWIEDESRMIGNCMIPRPIFERMQAAPITLLEASLDERIQRIVMMYGQEDARGLIAAVQKIQKKLGLQRANLVISLIQEGDLYNAVSHLLEYYDKAYAFSMSRKRST